MFTNETMGLLGDGPIIDRNKNGRYVPKLEQVRTVLLHCNVVHNIYKTVNYYILLFRVMLLVSYFLSNQ